MDNLFDETKKVKTRPLPNFKTNSQLKAHEGKKIVKLDDSVEQASKKKPAPASRRKVTKQVEPQVVSPVKAEVVIHDIYDPFADPAPVAVTAPEAIAEATDDNPFTQPDFQEPKSKPTPAPIAAYENEDANALEDAKAGEFVDSKPEGVLELDLPSRFITNILNVQALQKRYAVLMHKGKTRIVSRSYDNGGVDLIELKSFHEFYRYLNAEVVINKNGMTRREYASYEFMDSDQTGRYLGLVFNPRGNSPKAVWNLWEGFQVKRKKGKIKLFLKLLWALCNGNRDHMHYFLDWLAHMVQKPWELPEVAIVLRGAQGIGKGTLMKILGKFTRHYLHLSSSRPLVGNFNGILANALLVFCDESVWGGDKSAEGTLKALITEKEHSINEKMEKEYMIDNYKRFIFASNEEWAVPVGAKDRRYFVLDCNPKYKGKTNEGEFFWKIDQAMKNEGLVEAVFDFLMERDISEVNIRQAPKTNGYVELMAKSMDTCTHYLYDMISGSVEVSPLAVEDEPDGTRWYKTPIYNDFIAWCNTRNIRHIPSADEFGKKVSAIFEFSKDTPNWRQNWKHRQKGAFYKIPKQHICMELFAKNYSGVDANSVFPDYEFIAPAQKK